MEDDPSALPPGALLAGKFRVIRCLGMGGMGAVYEIEHELTKHRRALKLLHAQMAQMPGIVERFLREASAAGRVGNPHIIETFDAGTLDTGEPYLVMEILRGETLTDRIEKGPMPVTDVVNLMGQACDGVQAAHDAGIVHRDLKPDNLFIIDVDGQPFVKLLDFGISKFDPTKTGGLALTQEGAALGTPYYMSPEQIRGETSLDARADTYALGVILYECLAGRRPFDADSLTQLAVLIHTGQPVPLRELRPDLPAGLIDVVARAMAPDRSQRYASTRELRDGLAGFGRIAVVTSHHPGGGPSLRGVSAASVPPGLLATSAAGVSVRNAVPARKKTSGLVIGAGFAALAILGGGAFLALRAPPTLAGEPAAPSAAPPVPAAAPIIAASPTTPTATAAEPAASSSAAAAVPERTFPVVAPSLAPPPAPRPEAPIATAAARPAPAAPTAATQAPAGKPGRAEKRGLAKDNPFR